MPDPASSLANADDASLLPEVETDPVEEEDDRDDGFGAVRPDLA